MEEAGKAPEDSVADTATAAEDNKSPSGLLAFLSKLPGTLFNWLKQLAQLTNLTKFMLAAIFLMAIFVLYSAFYKQHQWIFSVQAQSRVAELVTPPNRETKWRINDAIICSREALDLPAEQSTVVLLRDKLCGKHWQGYRTSDPEQTLILKGAIHVVFETRQDHTLLLALRTHKLPGKNQPTEEDNAVKSGNSNEKLPPAKTGAWLSFTGGMPDIALGKNGKLRINIIFPKAPATNKVSHTDRVFPFSADTTIGRDVNWTGTSMLTTGSIQVYTADKSPDKRMLVDETELLLGDQLRLDPADRDKQLIYPKGFIRFSPEETYFDVIAFGAADRVHIERFGDNGYDFKPGMFSQLIHDPIFVLIASLFSAVFGLIISVVPLCGKKDCK